MKKNIFFVLLSLFFFMACQKEPRPFDKKLSADVSVQNATTHPNIILIVGDDVGYPVLGCNGGQAYQTPNLDNMAATGRRFTQCHASPLCSPSRAALLTGKYNFRNYTKWGYLDPSSNKTIGNMMQDAGYATCYAGKWQLDGYDVSIHAFGWQKYRVWDPGTESDAGSRYKSPHIYQDAAFLPDNFTLNKYADDMFYNYITAFMDTVTKPFFIYYSMDLVHAPFSPTPDDPEFQGWDPFNEGNVKFFPSMMKYMDKKVGQLLSKAGPNTVVIYVGDNGSPLKQIDSSLYDMGGKGHCTEAGTHVPLIIYKPGKAPDVDSALVDLTDLLPTLASIAKIPLPTSYGILDGTVFYPLVSARQWIYYHYNPEAKPRNDELTVWVQNSEYKKYDSTVRTEDSAKRNKLFNIRLDPDELHPIKPKYQTPKEKNIDSSFKSIIRFYARQQQAN